MTSHPLFSNIFVSCSLHNFLQAREEKEKSKRRNILWSASSFEILELFNFSSISYIMNTSTASNLEQEKSTADADGTEKNCSATECM